MGKPSRFFWCGCFDSGWLYSLITQLSCREQETDKKNREKVQRETLLRWGEFFFFQDSRGFGSWELFIFLFYWIGGVVLYSFDRGRIPRA